MKKWRQKAGKYIHDGDCLLWDKYICTCGLLHYFSRPRRDPDLYYGDYGEDRAKHEHKLSEIDFDEPELPDEMDKEEVEEMINEIFEEDE